jgi:uncharacterized protein YlxW (UPF0749 family)
VTRCAGTSRALGLQLEDDYKRPVPPRWSQPWSSGLVRATTAVGALLVGFLLTTGLTAGREAALEQGARKAELIALVGVRQERAATLAERLEELRARVTAAEQSVRTAGAPSLNDKLARAEAATGLTAIRGPGVRVTFSDATGTCSTGRVEDCRIQDVDLQLAANTLWGSGAEAVAINGERIIATSAIRSAGSSVLINYRVLTSPYAIEAIGDPDALQADFVTSTLAEDFEVWKDVFGLGFEAAPVNELILPAYTGAVRLRTAVNPEAGTDR